MIVLNAGVSSVHQGSDVLKNWNYCSVCLEVHELDVLNCRPGDELNVGISIFYTVSQKTVFVTSINFDKFWQKDGKEAKIMWDAFVFHIT